MFSLCVAVRLVTNGKKPSGYTKMLSGNRLGVGRCTGCGYGTQERGRTVGRAIKLGVTHNVVNFWTS